MRPLSDKARIPILEAAIRSLTAEHDAALEQLEGTRAALGRILMEAEKTDTSTALIGGIARKALSAPPTGEVARLRKGPGNEEA